MEAAVALREQPEIRELFQVLEGNGLKKERQEVETLVNYLEGMESQFGQVMKELKEVRGQLEQIQDRGIKATAARIQDSAEGKVREIGGQIALVKTNLVQSAKNAVHDYKEKGMDTLRRAVSAMKMGWGSYGDKQYVPHVLRYYIFGRIPTGTGSGAIVQVALTQEGNGGDAYWSWYGFDSRVEWCACFVSWCAEQCGYLESGVIPKFSLCSDGVDWFHARGQFQDASYVPAAGDIIFFDWENDGTIDHVGIVESVTNGVVNTIEGNSGDVCARRSYSMGSDSIYGYGVPLY